MEHNKKLAQEIVDLFFESGATVARTHYEFVLSCLNVAYSSGMADGGKEMIGILNTQAKSPALPAKDVS